MMKVQRLLSSLQLVNPSPRNPRNRKTKIWTTEMVDTLIGCLNDEKSKFEFKGLDFEADLVKLYSSIRKKMAEIYKDGQFGVVDVEEIAEGLSTKERALGKTRFESEEKAIKSAYDRIKTKAKEIRQNNRKAVSEGRRSGSGKIVCDNWEKPKSIWEGSPYTACIENSVSSISMDDEVDPFNEYREEQYQEEEEGEMSDGVCSEAFVTTENDVSSEDSLDRQKRTVTENVNAASKFVDNNNKKKTWRKVFLQVSVTRSI